MHKIWAVIRREFVERARTRMDLRAASLTTLCRLVSEGFGLTTGTGFGGALARGLVAGTPNAAAASTTP